MSLSVKVWNVESERHRTSFFGFNGFLMLFVAEHYEIDK